MKNELEIVRILENTLEYIKKLQEDTVKQEEFESYVKTILNKIEKDVAVIKKSII